jgi:hypothetical protein
MTAQKFSPIRKMKTEYVEGAVVQYNLPHGEELIPVNQFLGQRMRLEFDGKINCVHCDRKIKKSFSQGYCFPCFQSLPEADMCIIKPELCHFDKGTCRDSEWGQTHCFVDHTIYLANSSGVKVGITRTHQQTTRWMDQGAVQALAFIRVKKRHDAGKIEVALKAHVADKTNWRKMLKGETTFINLKQLAEEFRQYIPSEVEYEFLENSEAIDIKYPVQKYPTKVSSFNLDKDPIVEGELQGIKGQYLIFDNGVINMRKYAGYNLAIAPV